MTRFSQLIDDVPDDKNHSLTSVLMRAKVLAGRVGSDKLTGWLNDELNGYPDEKSVPEYRRIFLALAGDFMGYGGAQVTGVGLPAVTYPEDIRDFLQGRIFAENIGSIEGMLAAQSDVFDEYFDSRIVSVVRKLPGPRIDGYQLQAVHRHFTKAQVRGVLQHIRSMLLDLLLEVRREYPELEDDEKAERTVSSQFVDNATARIVYNLSGNVSVSNHNVNVGRDINVGGGMVLAETITGSFNRVKESSAEAALSKALTALVQQVHALSGQLDVAQAKQLAEDVDGFVKEAVKQQPRKPILIALGEGLKATAQTVGQLALPVLNAYNNTVHLLTASGTM